MIHDSTRSIRAPLISPPRCDFYRWITTWYQFYDGQKSQKLASISHGENTCGTTWPGWLQTNHPTGDIFSLVLVNFPIGRNL